MNKTTIIETTEKYENGQLVEKHTKETTTEDENYICSNPDTSFGKPIMNKPVNINKPYGDFFEGIRKMGS